MNRRGFLTSILAAGAAPAVVKADSLMKIIVPPERKILVVEPSNSLSELIDHTRIRCNNAAVTNFLIMEWFISCKHFDVSIEQNEFFVHAKQMGY